MFLPVHLPALLGGLAFGPWAGLGAAGATLVGELLVSGPRGTQLVCISAEFLTYGVTAGLAVRNARSRRAVFLALLAAMILGRVAYWFCARILGNTESASELFLSLTLDSWPGMVIQLAVLPILAFFLRGSRLSPVATFDAQHCS